MAVLFVLYLPSFSEELCKDSDAEPKSDVANSEGSAPDNEVTEAGTDAANENNDTTETSRLLGQEILSDSGQTKPVQNSVASDESVTVDLPNDESTTDSANPVEQEITNENLTLEQFSLVEVHECEFNVGQCWPEAPILDMIRLYLV